MKLAMNAFVVVLAWLAAGCFEPTYPDGIQCSERDACPPDMFCDPVDHRCRRTPVARECGDGVVQPGEVCEPGVDACCAATCDGFAAAGVQCRAAAGQCDPAETCTGESAACPGDAQRSDGSACSDCASGACDVCVAGVCTDACGNGVVESAEQCEPGDDAACPGHCNQDCTCTWARTCKEYLDAAPGAPSGLYTIAPDSAAGAPMEVFCDMTTEGGGWTLVQRTVWDWADTSLLHTDYATFESATLGLPAPGAAYRLAARHWPGLQQSGEHMMREVPRRVSDGGDCGSLYYLAMGAWSVPAAGEATITAVSDPYRLFNTATRLSASDGGPSTSCVTMNFGVPWFYTACCSTCPSYKGGYWIDEPHPMSSQMGNADVVGETMYTRCAPDMPRQSDNSSGYYGVNVMEYYLR